MCVLAQPPLAEFTADDVLDHVLPLERGLTARLDRGLNVFQPACGDARLLVTLAQRFPRSRFGGTEDSGAELMQGRRQARLAGVQNLWLVHARREARAFGTIFDFALLPDASAAGTDNEHVLAACAAQLKPGGVLLLHTRDRGALRHTLLPHVLRGCGFAHVRVATLSADPDGFVCLARR